MLNRSQFSQKDIDELRKQVSKARDANERLRLSCIYLFVRNKEIKNIAEYLIISEKTVYLYLKEYNDSSKTKNNTNSGRSSLLTKEQELELEKYLQTKIHQSTKDIQSYIAAVFNRPVA